MLDKLQQSIGYRFHDESLLVKAMTHSSYVNEHGLKKQDCNERLEFLGDAILEQISSRYLYEQFPELMEGDLSRKRSACVSEKSLAKAAVSIGIGPSLRLGKGAETTGSRTSDAVLSDAFEALLAALALDGGIETATRLVHEYVLCHVSDAPPCDEKTMLQQTVQQQNGTVSYVFVSESGPDHQKEFVWRVLVNGTVYGTGKGRSKKEAQSAAAGEAIERIRNQKGCI